MLPMDVIDKHVYNYDTDDNCVYMIMSVKLLKCSSIPTSCALQYETDLFYDI
jgi:hypothetical protein